MALINVYICVWMCVRVCIYVCVFIYMYVCVCVCESHKFKMAQIAVTQRGITKLNWAGSSTSIIIIHNAFWRVHWKIQPLPKRGEEGVRLIIGKLESWKIQFSYEFAIQCMIWDMHLNTKMKWQTETKIYTYFHARKVIRLEKAINSRETPV